MTSHISVTKMKRVRMRIEKMYWPASISYVVLQESGDIPAGCTSSNGNHGLENKLGKARPIQICNGKSPAYLKIYRGKYTSFELAWGPWQYVRVCEHSYKARSISRIELQGEVYVTCISNKIESHSRHGEIICPVQYGSFERVTPHLLISLEYATIH